MSSAITTALILRKTSNESKESKSYELVNNFTCPLLKEEDVILNIHTCCLSRNSNEVWLTPGEQNKEEFPVGSEVSGTVTEVGKSVSRFKVGDKVVGIVPPNTRSAGCAKTCILSQYDVVLKPEGVSDEAAVVVLKDAVKAYTALHYLARVSVGDTLLLCNGGSGFGLIVVQLACHIGAKVIVTERTDEGLNFLRRHLKGDGTVIVDIRSKKLSFVDTCMEETGGLGIDCIIDDGVEMYGNSVEESQNDLISFEENTTLKPHKHDVISSLAVGGRWITVQSDLQLDPPDSNLLFLKCASLHFLFEDSWTLSKSAYGKYLHILEDILENLRSGILRPPGYDVIQLEECVGFLTSSDEDKIKKIVVRTARL